MHGAARRARGRGPRRRSWSRCNRLRFRAWPDRPARARGGSGGHGGPPVAPPRLLAQGRRPVTIRLLLADDQALVRGALSALLGLEPDFEVVAEVASGGALVPGVPEHPPDRALVA